jgi:SAM-dependent methyltransferase
MNLPNYPLNSQYLSQPSLGNGRYNKDFDLMGCNNCGHIFGESSFHTSELYHDEYCYRPSSPNINWRVHFLIGQLEETVKHIQFNRVIDIGCNNGQLLRKAKEVLNAEHFIGVDPAIPLDVFNENEDIIFIKDFVQNIKLPYFKNEKPDLIISDQCFEHIQDLNLVISDLYKQVGSGSKFFICVPSLEAMIDKLNFQFVIHEHLNYFSLRSLYNLFKKHSLNLERYVIDYLSTSNFILTVFSKGNEILISENELPLVTLELVKNRISQFKNNISYNTEFLKKIYLNNRIYGFGASDLTSNLAYFMNTDLEFLSGIIDDTSWKNNMYMPGIKTQISNSIELSEIEYKNSYCLITAPQASRHLMVRINELGFKGVIIPTAVII